MKPGHLSIAERNRPRKFGGFFGKQEAVAYLLKQIAEDRGRSVLLHGGSGTGKSSLGRVYALALLCEHEGDGERPCLTTQCASCGYFLRTGRHPNLRVFEHGRVSDEEFAAEVIKAVRVESAGNGRFVVLITRAHLLSERALDELYNQMKRPSRGVTFILCADEINAVPATVASLFYPIEVSPPALGMAVEYITYLCREEGITLDLEAIDILADFGRVSFERLALDLEVVVERGIASARGVLEYYVRSAAADYVDLVLERKPFEAQLQALINWQAPPDDVIRQVGWYLSGMFDARHGLRSGSLHWLERRSANIGLINKHAEMVKQQPQSFAAMMLRIWEPEARFGIATLRRKASEFDELFASARLGHGNIDQAIAVVRSGARRTRAYRDRERAEFARSTSQAEAATGVSSLTLEEARKLWDGASFMVQAYGAVLNTFIEIRHGKFVPEPARAPEQTSTSFLHELRQHVKRVKLERAADLHTLYAHRSDEEGRLVTRVVAHMPRCKADVPAWIRDFQRRIGRNSSDEAISIDFSESNTDFARHLDLIRSLCAGIAPTDPQHQVFLRRARINIKQIGWSPGDRKTFQRIGLSRMIDTKAQEQASEDLEVIFAFDHRDADPCSGWERGEFGFRKEIAMRRLRLESVARERNDRGLALTQFKEHWKSERVMRTIGRPGFHS